MTLSSGLRRSLLLGGLASVFAVSASGEGTIDLPGATAATVAWEAAEGPVAGYFVVVTRNDQSPTVSQITSDTQATLSAVTGEELVVYVAAFDATGVAGPISPPSPRLRFLPAGSTTDDGTSSDPPPDEEPVPGEPPEPIWRAAVPFDYTGDGLSDLLVAPGGDVELLVMEAAQIVARHDLPELPAGWSIAAHGDYDGNGFADVLWREEETGALLVWAMQDADVASSGTPDLSHLATPRDWTVEGSGDLDGDGRDDVVLRNRRTGELDLLLMAGTSVASTVSVGGRGTGFSIAAVADVDGDAAAEVVWLDERRRQLELGHLVEAGLETRFLTASLSWRVKAAGDFDGDGRADLFVQRRNPDEVAVWLSSGHTVGNVVPLPHVGREWSISAHGDYDGDARTDLLWYNGTTQAAEIWFSDGTGITREALRDGTASGGDATLVGGSSLQCEGDLDGDGLIGAGDLAIVLACLSDPSQAQCASADVDGDGVMTDADFYSLRERFGWSCSEGL